VLVVVEDRDETFPEFGELGAQAIARLAQLT
jgi:hypothetical protein